MKKRIYAFAALLCCLALTLCAQPAMAMGFDFSQASKSVFVILAQSEYGSEIAIGSGFAVDDKHIITNAHVIEDSRKVGITTYSETGKNHMGDIFEAEIVDQNDMMDIAILEVDDLELTPLPFADAKAIREGDVAYAIGAPKGLAYTLSKGTVSSKGRNIDNYMYVQTDAPITYGNSGGPLLNDRGEVLGVNTFMEESEKFGFALRIDEVSYYLEKTINYSEKSSLDPWLIVAIAVAVAIVGSGIAVLCVFLSRKGKKAPAFDPNENGNGYGGAGAEGYGNGYGNAGAGGYGNAGAGGGQQGSAGGIGPTSLLCTAGIAILSGAMAGNQFNMADGETLNLGKDPAFANVVLAVSYNKVSRKHCSVRFSSVYDRYTVIDCSSNGTYYESGERLPKNVETAVARGTVLKLADEGCKIQLL